MESTKQDLERQVAEIQSARAEKEAVAQQERENMPKNPIVTDIIIGENGQISDSSSSSGKVENSSVGEELPVSAPAAPTKRRGRKPKNQQPQLDETFSIPLEVQIDNPEQHLAAKLEEVMEIEARKTSEPVLPPVKPVKKGRKSSRLKQEDGQLDVDLMNDMAIDDYTFGSADEQGEQEQTPAPVAAAPSEPRQSASRSQKFGKTPRSNANDSHSKQEKDKTEAGEHDPNWDFIADARYDGSVSAEGVLEITNETCGFLL